jgi:hypothetical protein
MSTFIQIAGAVAITTGVVIMHVPIGVIVGGGFLILIGLALGRN